MIKMDPELPLRRVAFLGAFLPRRCPTAEATTRLLNAFAAEFSECECLAVAVSDKRSHYLYPSRVRFDIEQNSLDAYRAAADFLNQSDVDLVCIQLDDEIFSGSSAGYLSAFAQLIKATLVAAFFKAPGESTLAQQPAVDDLLRRSSQVVVYQAGTGAAIPFEDGEWGEKVTEIRLPDGSREEHSGWRAPAHHLMTCFQTGRQYAAQQRMQQVMRGGSIPVTGVGDAIIGAENSGAYSASPLPVLKLDHFLRMIDDTGMLKSSTLGLPDYRQGYSTADNARALMFSLLLEQVGEGPFIPIETQASRHLAFLWNAFNPERGRFRDALSYRRDWLDEEGSEDTHGMALWALGMTLGRSAHPGMLGVARELFNKALPVARQLTGLRAWGFSLLGIQEYLDRFSGDLAVARTGRLLLNRVLSQYREASGPDWPWFEEALTASSAVIPQALIASARWANDAQAVELGFKTLEWLAGLQFTEDGMFEPLGDAGYYRRGGQQARFSQRPIEARGMISACLEAYRYSGDERWLKNARGAFQWFLGRNDLGQPLYDAETGGCCDGILPGKIGSKNYSAEALLAFLAAQLEMRLFDQLFRRRAASGPRLPILPILSANPLIHKPEE